jgi:ribose transport system substrate-binding protein
MQKGAFHMRNTVVILICSVFFMLSFLTFDTAKNVFRSDWHLPSDIKQEKTEHRLVLITQDLETPFWDKVAKGALNEAKQEGASLEVWGSYSNDQEDFLKKIEIAIHSKVDGIILQGLDTKAFKELTKIKASFYGIPIVTVANDVPVAESLRKTYVGSDQYKAGRMLARNLLSDMGVNGSIIVLYDDEQEYYQVERLKGIQDVMNLYPNVQLIHAETSEAREQVIATTQNILNEVPDVDGFIAINANIVGPMVKEIGKRFQVEPFYIYSFDDGPETLTLLQQGKLDGIIKQDPEMMGKVSVQRLVDWLNGASMPLHIEGYFTDIQILKENDY